MQKGFLRIEYCCCLFSNFLNRLVTSRWAVVHQFYFELLRVVLKQDVFRLYITMYYAHFLAIGNRWQTLVQNISCVFLSKLIQMPNIVQQFSSFAIFSDQIKVVFILVSLINFSYVWMVDLNQFLHFNCHPVKILLLSLLFHNLLYHSNKTSSDVYYLVDLAQCP